MFIQKIYDKIAFQQLQSELLNYYDTFAPLTQFLCILITYHTFLEAMTYNNLTLKKVLKEIFNVSWVIKSS